jgi:uncharacterized protein YaaN involved in tellurite resistance
MSTTPTDLTAAVSLPAIVAKPAEVARIEKSIDLSDRAQLTTFGEGAQRSVTAFADKILEQTRNRDMGNAGKLLLDVLEKAKGLDPASLKDGGFLSKMFSSLEARVRRFAGQFEDVAGQIDGIAIELDKHKDRLKRDLAVLDDLHQETRDAIASLDAYILAGKNFGDDYRKGELVRLKSEADGGADGTDAMLKAQSYQDAAQALDRLEKRVYYLQQARQIGIQQLPQIRIVQAGDETLIENLQATAQLTIPAWKQKMILLLGLTRQKQALDLQRTVTDATNSMMKQASEMMKDQAIAIEEQSQRGIIDLETLEQTNKDLIDTIGSVLKIQSEGRGKRAAAEEKMETLTSDLRRALAESKV